MSKSKASKTTSKAASFKSEITTQIAPEFEGTEAEELIFPEWSDQELNAEKWDHPKAVDKDSKKEPKVESSSDSPKVVVLPPPPLPFRDPHSFTLPSSTPVYKWKRPEVLFPDKTLVIYNESTQNSPSNFSQGNHHIFQSSFFRSFVSNVGILEYLSTKETWPMEGVTASFTPNTLEEPWRPWHHVYSNCKAGKGQKHKPLVNKLGKYVLRIFWLGAWRRIVVDDFIPVDKEDKVLLPKLHISESSALESDAKIGKKDKKSDKLKDINNIELWPFLLCKGIIKIANLTWTENRETYDVNVLYNLTGWICQKLNTYSLDCNEVWEICSTYAEHYKWPVEADQPGSPSEKSSKSKKSKKDDKGSKTNEHAKSLEMTSSPFCVVAKVLDTRSVIESIADNTLLFPPCWSHVFLIKQVRDITINKPDCRLELALWKRFRWVDWARNEGVYYEEKAKIRYLQIVDIFKDVETPMPQKSYSATETYLLKRNAEKGLLTEKHAQILNILRSKENFLPNTEQSVHDQSKEQLENPETWVDFYQFGRFIDNLYIFFKPQLIHTCVTITDVQDKRQKGTKDTKTPRNKNQEDGQAHYEKKIIWPYQIKSQFNQPLYIFFDTLDPKILLISLSTSGNRKILEQKCLVVHCDLNSLWQKKFCFKDRSDLRTVAHVVVEKYDWQSETFGQHLLVINTTGIKTAITSLKEGRQVLRFWIQSTSSYNVTILSDATCEIGPLEYILEVMQSESERLLQFCLDFGTAFGNLVKSFGTDDYSNFLKTFHSCYQPQLTGGANKKFKKEKENLRKDLLEACLVVLKEKYPECGEVLFCLRVLFLAPDLGKNRCPPRKPVKGKAKKEKPRIIKVESPPLWDDIECLSDSMIVSVVEDPFVDLKRERAACTIQAFFKMIYVKKLKEYHNESSPMFPKIFDTLKKLYKDLFNVEKRIEILPGVIRKILMISENDASFFQNYAWYDDLFLVTNNQILLGSISTPYLGFQSQWVPIARYIFFIDSPFDETVKISMFSDIDQFVLKVINNDTLEESFRTVECPIVSTYSCNSKGYTILSYGWVQPDSKQKTFNYKINLATLKRSDKLPLIIEDHGIEKMYLADGYHHNKQGLISKAIVEISQDVSLTLRLKCSYDQVKLKLKCLTKDGKLVREWIGMQSVIIPVINLIYYPPDPPSVPMLVESSKKLSKIDNFKSKRSLTLSSTSLVHSKKKSAQEKMSTAESLTSKDSWKLPQKSSKADKCYYIIEGHVLKKSWPLTRDEWKESDKLISKNMIGLGSTKGSSSSRSNLRKLNTISSKTKLDYDVLPNPKWSLQLIHNSETPIQLNVDQSRCKEIRAKKLQWAEEYPGRFERAKKLRDDYLEEMRGLDGFEENEATPSSGSYYDFSTGGTASYTNYEGVFLKEQETEDKILQQQRTWVHPDSSSKSTKRAPLDYTLYAYPSTLSGSYTLLQKMTSLEETTVNFSSRPSLHKLFDFNGYEGKCFEFIHDVDSGILKKPKDFENDLTNMHNANIAFEMYHQDYIKDMADFRERSLMKGFFLEKWFAGIRTESERCLAKAYLKRDRFIESLEEKEAGLNPSKNDIPGRKSSKSSKSAKSSKGSVKSKKTTKK